MSPSTLRAMGCVTLMALAALGCGSDDEGSDGMSGSGATSGGGGTTAGMGAAGASGGGAGTRAGGAGGMTGDAGAGGAAGGPPAPGGCAPSEGPDAYTLRTTAEMVVTPAGFVRSQLIHEGYLYYTEDGVGMQRVAESGGTPEVLIPKMTEQSRLLGFEDGFVYFKQTYDDPYARVPTDDWGATAEVQGGTSRGFANVISDGYLYGHGGEAGPLELWRQQFVSGTVEVLATVAEEVGGLDVADGYVYYTDNSFGVENLFRVPIAGGTPQQLSEGSHFSLQSVRVIDGKVYWADGYAMFVTDPSIADPAASTQRLGFYAPDESAIGNGTRGGWGFTAHGDRIYWIDDAGNVGWTAIDRLTCGAVLLQDELVPATVLLGADHAYVIDDGVSGEGIWRTPL